MDVVPWPPSVPGPCITNVFATRRKNSSQRYRSFQRFCDTSREFQPMVSQLSRKLRYHWLEFLRRVAKTLVIQGPEGHRWVDICVMTGFQKSEALSSQPPATLLHATRHLTLMVVSPWFQVTIPVKLPGILIFNGAPGNIQDNLGRYGSSTHTALIRLTRHQVLTQLSH